MDVDWTRYDNRLRNRWLGVQERGAILSPHLELDAKGLAIHSTEPDPHSLRMSLLLFDQFDWPKNYRCDFDTKIVPALEEFGLMAASAVTSAEHDNNVWFRALYNVYLGLDDREPSRWVLSRGDKCAGFPQDMREGANGVALSLYDAIPIPDRDVAIDDVLAFKARRSDELQALRVFLEELITQIVYGDARSLAELNALGKFDRALSDWSKSIRGANWNKALGSMDISIAWDRVLPSLLGGATMVVQGLPLSTAALGTATGVASSIGLASTKGLKKAKHGHPFEYVTSIHRSLY